MHKPLTHTHTHTQWALSVPPSSEAMFAVQRQNLTLTSYTQAAQPDTSTWPLPQPATRHNPVIPKHAP